ncbi:hypothetical protein LOTGIDRAFT_174920 [Lottia gigantea]|uniref:Glycosyl hydrolase-like 10 domain-containing protein n=1 Tax=Lottia gigantea TaxID=225164 RepID=V4ANA9_LOTGI|nr:hypothetical protein LOTGIDRAFT_174920 [Lottia gigantea]ESO96265.1 hypothetical protein LOTGIDRAFT_174920 [Lottia gigantea]
MVSLLAVLLLLPLMVCQFGDYGGNFQQRSRNGISNMNIMDFLDNLDMDLNFKISDLRKVNNKVRLTIDMGMEDRNDVEYDDDSVGERMGVNDYDGGYQERNDEKWEGNVESGEEGEREDDESREDEISTESNEMVIANNQDSCIGTFNDRNPSIGCIRDGCCKDTYQLSNLCAGNSVCCYSLNICNFCFKTYGTWISRYQHHQTEQIVKSAFKDLKAVGITRVYINIWANGNIYAKSSTAKSNGVNMPRDALEWAVNAGKTYGLEVFAWFEYGTQAESGLIPSSKFATESDKKGWLLKTSNGGYTTTAGGKYVYLNAFNPAVREFIENMTADIVKNYRIDGIQYDDHMSFPTGFKQVDDLNSSTRQRIMKDFMDQIKMRVERENVNTIVSYSPAPLDTAISKHNVDWTNYIKDGIVDEIVPQYYRVSINAYRKVLDVDIPKLGGQQTSMIAGIRLSGSSKPYNTPSDDVNEMIKLSYDVGFKGISFWLADTILVGNYTPPPLNICQQSQLTYPYSA